MQESITSNPSPTKSDKTDKDKKIKLMNDLLKTNQKHIEHLKQMVEQLKKVEKFDIHIKQLTFEQKQKEDVQKDNAALKKQIVVFKEKLKQNNLDETDKLSHNDSLLSNNKKNEIDAQPQSVDNLDDVILKDQITRILPNKQLDSSQKLQKQLSRSSERKYFDRPLCPDNIDVLELKINVKSILQTYHSMIGPLTSVKKSMTYMHELKDERLAQAMKRSLIILPESEKNGRNSSSQNSDLIKSQNSQTNHFSFNSPFQQDNPRSSLTPVPMIAEEESDFGELHINRIQSFTTFPDNQQETIQAMLKKEKNDHPRIFEDFYILGCKKKDFVEFDSDLDIEEGIIPAQILFKFSTQQDNSLIENNYEYIIHEFAYPFGIKAEKLKPNDVHRKLIEIMYSVNKYELLDKFHIFTLKNYQDDQNKPPFVSDVLIKCNPENRLYGISLTVYDYIESTDESEKKNILEIQKNILFPYLFSIL